MDEKTRKLIDMYLEYSSCKYLSVDDFIKLRELAKSEYESDTADIISDVKKNNNKTKERIVSESKEIKKNTTINTDPVNNEEYNNDEDNNFSQNDFLKMMQSIVD